MLTFLPGQDTVARRGIPSLAPCVLFRADDSSLTHLVSSMINRISTVLATAFAAHALSNVGLTADTWDRFRGPNRNGHADTKLISSWDNRENVTWRSTVPGEGWSSPVIADGKIFLTSATRNHIHPEDAAQVYQLCLLVFDLKSGQMLAKKPIIFQEKDQFKKIHGKNTHASPTPIVSGNRIYLHFGYQGTACTSLAGEVHWVNRDLSFPPVHGNGGSPVLVDDLLVFTCDGATQPYVAALDAATGELRWKRERPIDAKKKFSFCTPTVIEVDGKKQIVAPGSDGVVGLTPADGAIVWQVDYSGYSVVPQPIYADGLLFVCTGFDQGGLLAIDPSGTGNITDTNVRWQIDKGAPKTPSLIAHDGLLYSINDAGVACCYDASTGEQHWKKRIGGNFSASPILAGGLIYLTSEKGETTVIKASSEFEEVSRNDMAERTLASMAVDGSAIIMRTEGVLYRIE